VKFTEGPQDSPLIACPLRALCTQTGKG